jgi:tRNA A37 methylthiotransferase MiaB
VKPHDYEIFKHMAKAGCREVAFGVETADPSVLNLITSKGTVDDAYNALRVAKQAGLNTRALMMVGLPGETRDTFWYNLEFFAKAKFDALALAVFTPFPGCEIANNPAKFGCVLLPERGHTSVCLFSPTGEIDATPRISIPNMSDTEFRTHISNTIMAALATNKIGRG